MKHCNQSIDSLHLKLNSLDTQLKESATKNDVAAKKLISSEKTLTEFREESKDSMESISNKITDMENHFSQLEDTRTHSHVSNTIINNKAQTSVYHVIPSKQQNEKEQPRLNKSNQQRDASNQERSHRPTECECLILSDSILRRIKPKKFTPNGITLKRFIRGGASTCLNRNWSSFMLAQGISRALEKSTMMNLIP